MDGLKPGRVVYYRNSQGDDVPGLVTRVHSQESGTINLVIFPDYPNAPSEVVERKSSIPFEATGATPFTWHWMFDGQDIRYLPAATKAH